MKPICKKCHSSMKKLMERGKGRWARTDTKKVEAIYCCFECVSLSVLTTHDSKSDYGVRY